jgi:hypothetical protein
MDNKILADDSLQKQQQQQEERDDHKPGTSPEIVDEQLSKIEINNSESDQQPDYYQETREHGQDIVSGARKTDQIERMQENKDKDPAPADEKEGGPAVVKVNNGEPERSTSE